MISLILAYASIIDIIYEHNEVFFGTKKNTKNKQKQTNTKTSFYCTVILNKSLNQHFQQWPLQNHMSGQVI